MHSPSLDEMDLRSPHLRLGPLRPGLVREDLTHGAPVDQVQGKHQGESVRGVTRAEDSQVTRAIRELDHTRVRVVSVEHRVGVLQAAHESYNNSINQKFGKETDYELII